MEGLRKGVPQQRSLHSTQTLQQRPDEHPPVFLDRTCLAYRKHTDADPEAPEQVGMINMTFIGQSALDIRREFQCVDEALGTSPSQLVGIAFKVHNARETGKTNQALVFLEAGRGGQKKRQDPRGKRRDSLGAHHCGCGKKGLRGEERL